MAKSIVFPPVRPYWVFGRDCLRFPALVDGSITNCLVSGEALFQYFGAKSLDAEEARRAFGDHKPAIEEAARRKLESGEYNTRGEILLKTADFAKFTAKTTPLPERSLRVSYPEKLDSEPVLKALIVNATRFLEDQLFRTLPPVAVEWKLVPVSTGDTLAQLIIRDLETKAWVEKLFTVGNLNDTHTVRFSLLRLWYDLLNDRDRLQVSELQQTAASEE